MNTEQLLKEKAIYQRQYRTANRAKQNSIIMNVERINIELGLVA